MAKSPKMSDNGLEYDNNCGIQNSPLLTQVRPVLTFSPNLNHQFLIESGGSSFCPNCGIHLFTDVLVLTHILECTGGVSQGHSELDTSLYLEESLAVDMVMQDTESSIHPDAQSSPLRKAYSEKLDREGVFEEYHCDLLEKKAALDEAQKMQHIAGLELLPEDLNFLRNFRDEVNRVIEEREILAIESERLRRQCIEKGILGATEKLVRVVSGDVGQTAVIKKSGNIDAVVTGISTPGLMETEPDWNFPDVKWPLESPFKTSSQDQHRHKHSDIAIDTTTLFRSGSTKDERNNFQPDESQQDVQLNLEFEQNFLGAMKKYLPYLFPLVSQDATTQPVQPVPESRKRSRDEETQEMLCTKRQRTKANDDNQKNKAISHLETEFLYNPFPDAARIQALSVFTCLEISFIVEWFKRKNQDGLMDGLMEDSKDDSDQWLIEMLLPVDQVAKRDQEAVSLTGSDIIQRRMKDLRESKHTSQNNRIGTYGSPEDILAKHFPASGLDVNKPYSCTKEGCLMKFKTKVDWRRHEETHYPQSNFICLLKPECKSKKFPRKDKFLEHLKKCHDDKTYLPEMKNWQEPIASNTTFGCPCCDEKFLTWLGRCVHITTMTDECRKVIMKDHQITLRVSPASNEADHDNQQHPQTNFEDVPMAEDDHDASMDQNSAAKLGLPQSRGDGCDEASSYYFDNRLCARTHFVEGYKFGLSVA